MAGLLGGIGQVAEADIVPVIGFCGGPFTLASYLVEGGPSREYLKTKALMHSAPDVWDALMDVLVDITTTSLLAQVDAGASAVQIFDSWVGALDPDTYRRFAMPATQRILTAVADRDVPRIVFGVSTGELLPSFAEAGADVVGVDWRVPLDVGARTRRDRTWPCRATSIPRCASPDGPPCKPRRNACWRAAGSTPGHVFNLGWGVLPSTDPDVLTQLVDWVHQQPAPQ